jgi:UDPglucose--hexose-1-phosphate uridylyltransferase
MSQIRKDAFTGRWVIMAEPREAAQPFDLHFTRFTRDGSFCPFCENHEASTPQEIFAIRSPGSLPNGPGWSVRVVPNHRPRLRVEGETGQRGEGLYDLMNGIGAHEIIVETPRHDRSLHELTVDEIAQVMRAYIARIVDLNGDKRIRYILVFKNHGQDAGAHTITHSISQLMGLPITPRAIKAKLEVAREYYLLKERCVYCDALQQELRDGRRIIAQNEDFVSWAPFGSRFPFEMTVLPRSHNSAFSRLSASQTKNLAAILQDVLRRLDQTLGSPPYNLALHDRPFLRAREGYWKTIEDDFHWHFEILPQVFRITGFEWASGFFYNPVSPESAARCLAGNAGPSAG